MICWSIILFVILVTLGVRVFINYRRNKKIRQVQRLGSVMRTYVWKLRKKSQEAEKRGDIYEAACFKAEALDVE